MLELIQRCLGDDERTESMAKSAFGLMGDLADTFPNGQIKQLLLQEWIGLELRNRRGMSSEVKKTMRWAKEASFTYFYVRGFAKTLFLDGEAGHCIERLLVFFSSEHSHSLFFFGRNHSVNYASVHAGFFTFVIQSYRNALSRRLILFSHFRMLY